MSDKERLNGENNVVEQERGEQKKVRASLEGLLVKHFIDSSLSVTSADACLVYAREKLGGSLPADRVATALGYLSLTRIVDYAESTGRVEVDLAAAISATRPVTANATHQNG